MEKQVDIEKHYCSRGIDTKMHQKLQPGGMEST